MTNVFHNKITGVECYSIRSDKFMLFYSFYQNIIANICHYTLFPDSYKDITFFLTFYDTEFRFFSFSRKASQRLCRFNLLPFGKSILKHLFSATQNIKTIRHLINSNLYEIANRCLHYIYNITKLTNILNFLLMNETNLSKKTNSRTNFIVKLKTNNFLILT